MSHTEPTSVESKKKYGKYEDYEIESAVRTIVEAEEIKADSEKMKYVAPLLKTKSAAMAKTITSLKDLKAARQELEDDNSAEEKSESADEEKAEKESDA